MSLGTIGAAVVLGGPGGTVADMPHVDRTVGNVQVTALIDADFPAGPIVEAFPDVAAEELLASAATDPGVYAPGDEWRLRVRAWVVRHPEGLLLMDTGIGGPSSPSQAWAPVPGVLPDALNEIGVAPHHVDTVVISHVHDDHVGGLLDEDGRPMFASARHLLQVADLSWQRELATESEEDQLILDLLTPVEGAGLLEAIEGDLRLTDHLELHPLPGHTPGHQVLRVRSDGRRLVLCADTWNHPMQFAHPDRPSGPDNHHVQAAASRRALLAELLSHPGTVIAPTHLAESFGEVRSGRGGLAAWTPLD